MVKARINEWLEDKAWRDDAYTYGRALSKQEVIDKLNILNKSEE